MSPAGPRRLPPWLAPALAATVGSATCVYGVRATEDAAAGSPEVVYVGSTGCDADDATCEGRPTEQRMLRAMGVSAGGDLSALPDFAVAVGGLPAWLVTRRRPRQANCLFVTRVDRDDVLAIPLGDDGRLGAERYVAASGGRNPVYASVLINGASSDRPDLLLVANYNGPDDTSKDVGASVASLQIGQHCELAAADAVDHHGKSVDPRRQNAAHVHSVVVGRAGLAYVCDLGTDEIFTYRVDPSSGKLHRLSRLAAPAGAGPRHSVLHPSKPILYVVCEMGRSVLVIEVDESSGSLTFVQEVSLLDVGTVGTGSKAAEIVISPDGKHVYATNRGEVNTVTVFSVADADGTLSVLQQVQAPGFPRGMTLAQGGALLLVAGQSTEEVVAFDVLSDGRLALKSHLSEGAGVPPQPGAFAVFAEPAVVSF